MNAPGGCGPAAAIGLAVTGETGMPPRASVIVVNYRTGDLLAECVRHLASQSVRDFEVIIVDNGSEDGSLDRARAVAAGDGRFRFVTAGGNLGFAAGNNLAAALAQAPLLALLNPDAFAEVEWLDRLLDAASRYPDVAMFGSTQLKADDPSMLDGTGDHYFAVGLPWRGGFGWPVASLPPEGEVFSPCAAAALYRRTDFEAAGGFDESFFCYVEDVDLAFRLRLRGQRCIQVPTAVVRHVGGGSSTKEGGFARYYGTRNLIWCFVKNMPGVLFWPLLPLHLLAVLAVAVRAAIHGQTAPWKGMVDALRRLPWSSRRQQQAGRTATWREVARAMAWRWSDYVKRAPVVPVRPSVR